MTDLSMVSYHSRVRKGMGSRAKDTEFESNSLTDDRSQVITKCVSLNLFKTILQEYLSNCLNLKFQFEKLVETIS